MTRFTARRAVVTGAASGIGAEITRLLVAEGAHVVAADLAPATATPGVLAVQADICALAEIEGVIRTAERDSTAVMIRLGHTWSNLMVSVDATVALVGDLGVPEAEQLLRDRGSVRDALNAAARQHPWPAARPAGSISRRRRGAAAGRPRR